ncbi:hypothetical protein [Natranaeroarchaeum aerophilus]|uniref:Uncharacterized protein n=1 Tax=Natranaeroarchaeum aerophilus TaxID=2917711 RepID=A0AAE3K3Y6_9EURY|nr:hypothetical protein [Natranaeroarchaeum aerophilus]MCL9813012.1 hypothetical protein [Natranaeroarchaeum aerophilus]
MWTTATTDTLAFDSHCDTVARCCRLWGSGVRRTEPARQSFGQETPTHA